MTFIRWELNLTESEGTSIALGQIALRIDATLMKSTLAFFVIQAVFHSMTTLIQIGPCSLIKILHVFQVQVEYYIWRNVPEIIQSP